MVFKVFSTRPWYSRRPHVPTYAGNGASLAQNRQPFTAREDSSELWMGNGRAPSPGRRAKSYTTIP